MAILDGAHDLLTSPPPSPANNGLSVNDEPLDLTDDDENSSLSASDDLTDVENEEQTDSVKTVCILSLYLTV